VQTAPRKPENPCRNLWAPGKIKEKCMEKPENPWKHNGTSGKIPENAWKIYENLRKCLEHLGNH